MGEMHFSIFDYALFGGMLVTSALVGLYFGFFSKTKQDNPMEYLLGSKSMKILPVAISLTATHISAVTILGVPAEMYGYGIQYWATSISGLIVAIVTAHFFLPVFYDLQIVSCFTYLQKRFGQSVCSLASGIYTVAIVVHLPLLVYAPAIAFSQVTGVNLHLITPITCIVCVFYTTFGGLRAVVWTDTIQFGSMIVAIAAVIYLGTSQLGGVAEVFKIADRGDRMILFDFNTDPLTRGSFWSITVGLTLMWITGIGITPECVQRLVSVPSLKAAQKVVWIFSIGHILIKLFSVYNGLLIYGRYETCDPVIDRTVSKADQIFPYFVMDVGRAIPGLPGLFVAGVFSAALSSMSSCLNTLSGTLYSDFIKPRYPEMAENRASKVMKCLVALIGAICLALIFLVERLSNIFSLGITISGITAGVYLGAFTMGLLCPRANAKGVLCGAYASLITVAIIAIGAQLNVMNGNLKYPTLPFRTDGCNSTDPFATNDTANSTFVHIINENHDNSQVPWPFRISFMYYSLLGTVIVYVVGIPVSYMTSKEEDLCDLDERLLTPMLRKGLRQKKAQLIAGEKKNSTELKQLWAEKEKGEIIDDTGVRMKF